MFALCPCVLHIFHCSLYTSEYVWIHFIQVSGFNCQTCKFQLQSTNMILWTIIKPAPKQHSLCCHVCRHWSISEKDRKWQIGVVSENMDSKRVPNNLWPRPAITPQRCIHVRAVETVRKLWLMWRCSALNWHTWSGSVKRRASDTHAGYTFIPSCRSHSSYVFLDCGESTPDIYEIFL